MRSAKEDLQIRPARAADLPSLIALDAEVTGIGKPAYWQELFARSQATGEKAFLLVAEHGDRLEGFIVGEVRAWEFGSPPCGWIFAVQVRPKGRLKGVGTRLFEAICDAFRSAGVENIRTMLARNDALLLAFFRSQGMMAGPFLQLELKL